MRECSSSSRCGASGCAFIRGGSITKDEELDEDEEDESKRQLAEQEAPCKIRRRRWRVAGVLLCICQVSALWRLPSGGVDTLWYACCFALDMLVAATAQLSTNYVRVMMWEVLSMEVLLHNS